ncbi:MAG: hypothetical protein K0Q70_2881, partial [Rhodospirillales bacterium]|nr:hypothetical protein [Rhodospirillales bacterium]
MKDDDFIAKLRAMAPQATGASHG